MAPQHVQWGNTIVLLDNDLFREGYELGRACYFDTFDDTDDNEPSPDPQDWLHTWDIAETVLYRDHNGQALTFDPDVHPLTIVGVIAGYLSVPLHPQTPQEHAERLQQIGVLQEIS
jgi:hypothetical protein